MDKYKNKQDIDKIQKQKLNFFIYKIMSRVTNFPIITSKLNDIGLDSIEDIHPLDTVCYEGDSKLITASN
jgi:hypothetical protein